MNAQSMGANTRPVQKLVDMANQIADYFQSFPAAQAAPGVADHIKKFWTPKMIAMALEHVAQGGADLHPLARTAMGLLRG